MYATKTIDRHTVFSRLCLLNYRTLLYFGMRARGRLDNQKGRLCAREAEALWLEKSNRKLEIDKNWFLNMIKVNYYTKTSIHLLTENVGLFLWFVQYKLPEGPEIQSNRASFVSMEKR